MNKTHFLGRAFKGVGPRVIAISVGAAALATVLMAVLFLLRTNAPVAVAVSAPAAVSNAPKTIWITLPAHHCTSPQSRGTVNNPGQPSTMWLQLSGPSVTGPGCASQAPLSHFSQPAAPPSPGGI